MERVAVARDLEFVIETARAAGRLLSALFEKPHTVGHKSSEIDLVTEADLASEALIVDALRSRFPYHRILAEEAHGTGGPPAPTRAGTLHPDAVWIVDPLDGTVNYAHRYPVWGVSVSLAVGGRVEMAVTHDPLRGVTYWAERGRGAWCDGSRMHVSEAACLGEALLATGFPYDRSKSGDNNLKEFNALMPRVHGVRRAGAAVLDLAHVAAGRLDGYWEKRLRPWDWAAGSLLVEEAGGTATDAEGRPWSLECGVMVASNGRLHAELIEALQTMHAK